MLESEPEADGATTKGETTEDEKHDTEDEDFQYDEVTECEVEDNMEKM